MPHLFGSQAEHVPHSGSGSEGTAGPRVVPALVGDFHAYGCGYPAGDFVGQGRCSEEVFAAHVSEHLGEGGDAPEYPGGDMDDPVSVGIVQLERVYCRAVEHHGVDDGRLPFVPQMDASSLSLIFSRTSPVNLHPGVVEPKRPHP
jgi:hypothetical protein